MKIPLVLTSVFLGTSLFTAVPGPVSTTKKISSSSRNRIMPIGRVSIVIDKSDYELTVYDEKGWYATYPVVFGNNSLGDKKMEGDRNTPEGTFHILSKRVHDKWDRFMSLDYPNKESFE